MTQFNKRKQDVSAEFFQKSLNEKTGQVGVKLAYRYILLSLEFRFISLGDTYTDIYPSLGRQSFWLEPIKVYLPRPTI